CRYLPQVKMVEACMFIAHIYAYILFNNAVPKQ
ncbi:MAG: hypothetical protein ACI9WS_003486, partial [Paraglaciecola psychrophila]